MAWHIPIQSKIFYFHTLVGPNPRNIADRYFYMNIHKHMNTHTHTQGCTEGHVKGCQKLLAKWGKSAKIGTRITVKIIIEISCKQSEMGDRETDCDADTVSTRVVCVMRLQCKPKPKRKQKQKSQGLPCYKS